MNVVITGGNGFLGSRLAEKFVSKITMLQFLILIKSQLIKIKSI